MRFAGIEDFQVVSNMIREFLMEQAKDGSPVLVSRRTVETYRDLARCYITGSLAGVVVLAGNTEPTGFVLAGEDSGLPRLDTNLGRIAVVWAVWMRPDSRKQTNALKMLLFGKPKLFEMGFDLAYMAVRETNRAGLALTESFGAHPAERIFHFPLKEKPLGQRKQRQPEAVE